ncbi:MAG TPA: J domain-containing protein, partial [Candidatus Limnocylindria bacterium]
MTVSLLPYTPDRDVYRLLQVPPTAGDQEIAVACRRLALAFHPDHNRSPRAHEEMQVVNAVRNLLTDPHSRAVYDG